MGRGQRGVANGDSLSPASRARHLGQVKGRKRLTSDPTLRLVVQCSPGPVRQGLVPAAEDRPSAVAASSL